MLSFCTFLLKQNKVVILCFVILTTKTAYEIFNSWRAACNNHISDFLGQIFFPRLNELNFCMWPSTSQKNIPHPPHLSLLVSLLFSRNNVCKNVVFFPGGVLSKESFCFPNNRISEACICRECWFKKISQKRKTKQQKKLWGNVFPLSPSHMQKLSSFGWGKKIGLKSHLRGCSRRPFSC